jgi:hypothetical protein
LRLLLDAESMTPRVRAVLGRRDVTVETASLLDHKPGHRALVRYRVASPSGNLYIYGKAYAERPAAARVHALMRRLSADVFAGTPRLCVPQPLGDDPELALVLYVPIAGQSLDALPTQVFAPALGDAARWLATLHLSRLGLDRSLQLTHEVAGAAEWAALVSQEQPAAAASATQLAIALEQSGKGLRLDLATPIHKDFHYQHVIVGERVGVVDLDEARMGDPSFDLGHFVANLQLLALRSGASSEDRARWQDSFLSAYAAVTGWSADARFGWFAAYTCVKIAKQLASGRGPLPRPERGARAVQIDLILREGLSWLER